MFTGFFVEAIWCEIVHCFESLTGGGIYENFSAIGHRNTWIFCLNNQWASHVGTFKKSWRYVILTKLGQYVNEMMAVVKKFF